jgi:hypothetical protein
MAEFQNTIDLLGDDVMMKALLANTITEFHDDIVNNVRDYAFYNCSKLKSIIAPNATSVGLSAFAYAGLETADLPNVTTIGNSGFDGCKQLRTINIPLAEYISSYAFKGCIALAALDLPNVTAVIHNAFQGCKALVSVNLPRATRIDNSAFYGCTSLVSVNIPSFSPSFDPTSLFNGCSSLPNVDLPQGVTKVVTTMFKGCTVLKTLILRRESICTLSATDAFDGTPFASGGTGGKVLVPRALIESYETATNWSTLYAAGTCTFLAIEDHTVDGTIAGEIDWDKFSPTRSLINRKLSVVENSDVVTLGSHAFNVNKTLTSVNFPNLTDTGQYTFQHCTNLISVNMPKLTHVGFYAFDHCKKLVSIDLSRVTHIANVAFDYCTSLMSVKLPATPPGVDSIATVFRNINSVCVFYVPTGSLATYQADSDWSTVTSTYSFVEEDR